MARTNGRHMAQLAAKPPVKIMMYEKGTSGLNEFSGFITEAYNTALTWPTCQPLYSRLRRSNPEVCMVRNAFTSWGRNISVECDLPEDASDDDKRYQEFVQSVFDDMEPGFLDTLISQVPFMGWGWMEIVPGYRSPDWRPPDRDDDWRSDYDDNLIGLRRLAWRDTSSFDGWEFSDNGRMVGLWQNDFPNPRILLPKRDSFHVVYGDPNNPEGLSPLEAIWRLERIKYGLEVVFGIGSEHTAGYLNIQKTGSGTLSTTDQTAIAAAARAIMSAQEGNYATWPSGIEAALIDTPFSAANVLLEAIRHYGIMTLSVFTMQWIAISTMTTSGSYSAMQDSSQIAMTTFNAMMDGFGEQLDNQVGRKLWDWNKGAFPGATKRPKLSFSHLDKSVDLGVLGAFVGQIAQMMDLTEDDIIAIRKRSGFLPETSESKVVSSPNRQEPQGDNGKDDTGDDERMTPAQEASRLIRQSLEMMSRRPSNDR